MGESNQHTPEKKWKLNIGFLNVQNLYHILKNKYSKSIIEVRLFEIQYLKTKTKIHTQKKFRNIYEVWFKNTASLSLFLQGYSEMKMEIKEL